jgi:Na+-translocating ferredoxin:NAD+ oxidoreductase RnfE subunit
MSKLSLITKGIIKENPTFVLVLGMCPTLGTTTSAINGMGMGLATTFVLILSNMVISAIVSRNRNVLLLTTVELWVVTVLAWIFVFVGNSFPAAFPGDAVGGIVYLGLIATALCLFLQSYGLKYAEPAIGGMIISLESVFGVIFSVILYRERITFRMLAGFAVIFTAIVLSQWEGKSSEEKTCMEASSSGDSVIG